MPGVVVRNEHSSHQVYDLQRPQRSESRSDAPSTNTKDTTGPSVLRAYMEPGPVKRPERAIQKVGLALHSTQDCRAGCLAKSRTDLDPFLSSSVNHSQDLAVGNP